VLLLLKLNPIAAATASGAVIAPAGASSDPLYLLFTCHVHVWDAELILAFCNNNTLTEGKTWHLLLLLLLLSLLNVCWLYSGTADLC
jgi:hypothetical protein